MKIVKLHTTTSTNTYFKEWIQKNTPENFMIIATDEQTHGRGQRGNFWVSESGKNLTFSIFIKLDQFKIDRQFELNQAISLSLLAVLKNYIPSIKIKWPNDIMAEKLKIGGILFENTVSKSIIKNSIIGIGINVNQTKFSKELPNASSLINITDKNFELEVLLKEMQHSIRKHILLLENNPRNFFNQAYLEKLYLWKKNVPYEDMNGKSFEGKIIGISMQGKLQVELNKTKDVKEFDFKEIKFLS